MVSNVKYFRTFLRVWKRRTKYLGRFLKRKRKIDKKLRKDTSLTKGRARFLIQIIGKDTLFNSGEKRNAQSIRHYLWKFEKSIRNFQKFQQAPPPSSPFPLSTPFGPPDITRIYEIVIRQSNELLFVLASLHELYQKEVNALMQEDLAAYQKLLQQEEKIIASLSELMTSFTEADRSLEAFLTHILDELEGGKKTGFWLRSVRTLCFYLSLSFLTKLIIQFVHDGFSLHSTSFRRLAMFSIVFSLLAFIPAGFGFVKQWEKALRVST